MQNLDLLLRDKKRCHSSVKTAQRYGKGRAANGSETKPPNLEKKPNLKTANGRRVPLTDLLGLIVSTFAPAPKKLLVLHNCIAQTTTDRNRTKPALTSRKK